LLDEKDRLILRELERDCRQRTNQIARATNIPVTTVHNRIKKLRNSGHIRHFRAILDPDKLGKPILAFVFVTLNRHPPGSNPPPKDKEIIARIASHPSLQEVHTVTGEWDLLLKIRAGTIREVEQLLSQLREQHLVERTQTICAMATHKETTNLIYNGPP